MGYGPPQRGCWARPPRPLKNGLSSGPWPRRGRFPESLLGMTFRGLSDSSRTSRSTPRNWGPPVGASRRTDDPGTARRGNQKDRREGTVWGRFWVNFWVRGHSDPFRTKMKNRFRTYFFGPYRNLGFLDRFAARGVDFGSKTRKCTKNAPKMHQKCCPDGTHFWGPSGPPPGPKASDLGPREALGGGVTGG